MWRRNSGADGRCARQYRDHCDFHQGHGAGHDYRHELYRDLRGPLRRTGRQREVLRRYEDRGVYARRQFDRGRHVYGHAHHGDHGRGDGAAAGALKPSPVNFHVRQPSAERAWTVIEQGIPGSSMPAWKSRLSDDERRLLVKYVQSMYDSRDREGQSQ